MATRFSLVIGLLSVLTLAACQEDGPLSSGDAVTPDLFAIQREACEKEGGRWGPAGGDATYICYRTTRDANQQCRAASDCEGLCLARSRTCSPITPFLGCHEILTEGGARATQCVN